MLLQCMYAAVHVCWCAAAVHAAAVPVCWCVHAAGIDAASCMRLCSVEQSLLQVLGNNSPFKKHQYMKTAYELTAVAPNGSSLIRPNNTRSTGVEGEMWELRLYSESGKVVSSLEAAIACDMPQTQIEEMEWSDVPGEAGPIKLRTTQRTVLASAPNTLTMALIRIDATGQQKLFNKVEFTQKLDLTKYLPKDLQERGETAVYNLAGAILIN